MVNVLYETATPLDEWNFYNFVFVLTKKQRSSFMLSTDDDSLVCFLTREHEGYDLVLMVNEEGVLESPVQHIMSFKRAKDMYAFVTQVFNTSRFRIVEQEHLFQLVEEKMARFSPEERMKREFLANLLTNQTTTSQHTS